MKFTTIVIVSSILAGSAGISIMHLSATVRHLNRVVREYVEIHENAAALLSAYEIKLRTLEHENQQYTQSAKWNKLCQQLAPKHKLTGTGGN